MSRVFILEDDPRRIDWFLARLAGHTVHYTKLVEEAKRSLRLVEYDDIFLDHDLSPAHYEHYVVSQRNHEVAARTVGFHDATTGYAVADFLARHPELQRKAKILVHSMNTEAAKRMMGRLRECGRHPVRLAFHLLQERLRA